MGASLLIVSVAWDIISSHLKYDTASQCRGAGGGERLFPPLGDSCKTNWLQKLIKQHLLKIQDKQKMVLTKPFCFELLPPSTCVKMAVAEQF